MSKDNAIGIDIGGTNIRLALIDRNHEVILKLKEPTGDKPLEVIRKLLKVVYELYANEILGIGIAVAGIVDREKGMVAKSPNIPEINGVNLVEEIISYCKVPVLIENDANAAAYGEKVAGSGRDYRNFVVFTLGTGIGGGVIIDNELLPIAAELGHMTINSNGFMCSCGNSGCLEAYASATAIVEYAISRLKDGEQSILRNLYSGNYFKITAEDIYNSALEGDNLAREALRQAGKSLGLGLANIINIFSPEAIFLTGGLVGSWNIYVENAIREASRRALKKLFENTKILPSALGDNAGIIGVSSLVFKRFGT